MSEEYKVLVEYPTQADSPQHAIIKVREHLAGKGVIVTNTSQWDKRMPNVEAYIFIRPDKWT